MPPFPALFHHSSVLECECLSGTQVVKTLRVLMTDSMVLVVGAAIKAIGIRLTSCLALCTTSSLAFAPPAPLRHPILCYFAFPQAPSQSADAALLDLTHTFYTLHTIRKHITHLAQLTHLTYTLLKLMHVTFREQLTRISLDSCLDDS